MTRKQAVAKLDSFWQEQKENKESKDNLYWNLRLFDLIKIFFFDEEIWKT